MVESVNVLQKSWAKLRGIDEGKACDVQNNIFSCEFLYINKLYHTKDQVINFLQPKWKTNKRRENGS